MLQTVELLAPYFAAPDFNYDAARKASGAVAGLCNWAEAMCTYHEVAKVVEPKIAMLREAETALKVSIWCMKHMYLSAKPCLATLLMTLIDELPFSVFNCLLAALAANAA